MNSRRQFIYSSMIAALAGSFSKTVMGADPEHSLHDFPKNWHGNESISIVLYPGFTTLDVFGPHHFFILLLGAKVDLVAPTLDPVVSESGIKITPTKTFKDSPEKPSILFVPGGSNGVLDAAKSDTIMNYIAERGSKAEWVTSVCTGSVLLGVAGLLDGYKATSHWLVRDALKSFGATPVNKRVVIDRNRITGAGVTAGLDMGLELTAKLRDTEYAKTSQLFSEYDPQPVFNAGSPEKASPASVRLITDMHKAYSEKVSKLTKWSVSK
jgi:cyclohexyl-isocyanide hydratase